MGNGWRRPPLGQLMVIGAALGAAMALAAPGVVPAQRAAAAQPQGTWPAYHIDATNNAVVREAPRPPVSWRSPAIKDQILAASVVGDTVYAIGAGQTHAVYALNRHNGQLIWARIVDNIVMTQPVVADGRVFVGTGNNYMREDPVRHWSTVYRGTGSNSLYALDAATGAVLWRVPLQGEAMPTPVYHNGLLYWVTGDRRFLAIDAASGRIAWQLRLPSYMSMSSPVQDGNLLIFGGAHPYMEYAVDISSRRVAWEHRFDSYKGVPVVAAIDDCSPAVYNHMVFCTGVTSKDAVQVAGSPIGQFAWALDARTGRLLWQHDQGAGKLPAFFAAGVPVALYGVVYVESPGHNGFEALDARTGQRRWRVTLEAMGRSSPVVDGRVLYIADDKGIIYQFDAATGALLHRMRLGGSVSNLGLVLASGTLYIPNALGGVIDAIPTAVFTKATGRDVAPPHGPVVVTQTGGMSCG